MKKLKIGIPKGSLEEATIGLFKKAGFDISREERSYKPVCDDEELDVLLVRPQEMAKYIFEGVLDCGLTGFDWICESGLELKEICELKYSKSSFAPARWVIAVPEDSPIKTLKQLNGKRISTELMGVLRNFLTKKGIKAKVDFSWGATETKAGTLADAIFELTETGMSLRRNRLRIIVEVLTSTTRFVASAAAYKNEWKRTKMESIAMLLGGALRAQGLVGLKMNVDSGKLPRILKILPALKKPTISRLSDEKWTALEVVLPEKTSRELIPILKKAGACGIIEYQLTKVVE
ncbi:MAG: ATP phosphoribosyltransferase [Elusimicrobia bacterium]|nr:ATP phosphoribosyltransferase [Elusimicrobiota bacterium]